MMSLLDIYSIDGGRNPFGMDSKLKLAIIFCSEIAQGKIQFHNARLLILSQLQGVNVE